MSHQYMMFKEYIEPKGWKITASIPIGIANYRHIFTHKQYGDNAYIEIFTQLHQEFVRIWFKRDNLPNHEERLCFDSWTKKQISDYLKVTLKYMNDNIIKDIE